jgi:hypothetical protein
MSKTIRIKLYKFEELTPAAQSKAIDEYRNQPWREYAWQHENVDTLKAFCKLFDIDIKRGSDNPRFNINNNALHLSGQRLATYLWNNYRTFLYKGKYYYNKKSRRSRVMLENSCVLTGFYVDDAILSDVYAFMTKPNSRDFKTLLNNCLENWERAVREDREEQDSDLYIKETIIANDYDFTKDGKQY